MTKAIGIFLFNNIEVLDFAGPFEVFTTASRVSQRQNVAHPPVFNVFSIAETAQLVTARAGLQLKPDYALEAHPPIDVLIIPGGVVTAELDKPHVLSWIAQQAHYAERVASVCTGVFLLAKAGVITEGPVTTHWEDQQELADLFPSLTVRNGPRWVEQGKIATSAGIAAGIDLSLHLVSQLHSPELARLTARQMDYPWVDTN